MGCLNFSALRVSKTSSSLSCFLNWSTTLQGAPFVYFEALFFSPHCFFPLSLSLTSIACSSYGCTWFAPIHLSFAVHEDTLSPSFILRVIMGVLFSYFFSLFLYRFYKGNSKNCTANAISIFLKSLVDILLNFWDSFFSGILFFLCWQESNIVLW